MKTGYHIKIIAPLIAGLMMFSCEREISVKQSASYIKLMGTQAIEVASGVVVLDNGGYAICGTSSNSNGSSRMVLLVTDQYGNMEEGFPKFYTEGNLSSGANCIVARDGGNKGFLLGGFIKDESGDKDIYLVKTSLEGKISWTRTYGSNENESVLSATEGISNAAFMLAGYQEENGVKDIMIMGVRETGDSIPLSIFYNKPDDSNDAQADYILNTGENYFCVCTYNKIIGEDTDMMVFSFDEELSPIIETLPGIFDEYSKCIVQDDLESYIVLGNSLNGHTGRSEIILFSVTTEGISVKEISPIATISERDADLYSERIVKMADGKFAIIGTRKAGGDEDIFVQFLEDNQEGERILFGSAGNQSGADIGLTEDNGLILVGDNQYEGNSMITLIKTDDMGNF